ncbi:ALP1-like protein [Tanacetum coccineum]
MSQKLFTRIVREVQCPAGLRGQLCMGDSEPDAFILLEAVSSQDLYILHEFFDVTGSNNDINVIRQSPLLNDLKEEEKVPEVVLIKSISQPSSNDTKRRRNKQAHKAARKDVERAFGVIKKKWAIIKTPARSQTFLLFVHWLVMASDDDDDNSNKKGDKSIGSSSKLNLSFGDSLYLHPNDTGGSPIVTIKLTSTEKIQDVEYYYDFCFKKP